MTMKICHVITTINRGGAENHLLDLALAQRALGLEVFVFYLKGNGYWKLKFESAGVKVFNLHLKFYGDIFPIFRLKSLFRNIKPDIVHAHMPPAEIYSFISLLLIKNKPRFIISKHNDERFFDGSFSQTLARLVASKSKKIIAISKAVNFYFTLIFDRNLIDIKTIHYGLDPKPYKDVSSFQLMKLRSELNLNQEVLFGTIARLVPQKSLDIMLRAFALYKSSSSRTSKLILVGDGPLAFELKKLSFELGISNDVIWMGFREDIPEIINMIDVFVLTSTYEGFGLVLLEAMAASKPIIATAVSAIPEIVVDNKTGILCSAGHISEIASAMKTMEKSQYRKKLGKAGNSRLLRYFTVNKMTQQTISFYIESLNG
jgi:glycosyltransferase involved in cell wall biosynthesis